MAGAAWACWSPPWWRWPWPRALVTWSRQGHRGRRDRGPVRGGRSWVGLQGGGSQTFAGLLDVGRFPLRSKEASAQFEARLAEGAAAGAEVDHQVAGVRGDADQRQEQGHR